MVGGSELGISGNGKSKENALTDGVTPLAGKLYGMRVPALKKLPPKQEI